MHVVIASAAKQSIAGNKLDCFVASAPSRKRFAFVAGNDGCVCFPSIQEFENDRC